MNNLTDYQKSILKWLVVVVVVAALAFTGMKYPQPGDIPEFPEDFLYEEGVTPVELGTTHFSAIEAEDLTATDDLVVTDDASVGGDLTVTGSSTIGATGLDLNGASLTIDADADSILVEASDDLVTFTPGAATGSLEIRTGNFQIGNGTPGETHNGEDFYCEGISEFDGSAYFDGAVDMDSTLDVAGVATFSSGAGDAAVIAAGGVLSLPATADISAYGYVAVGNGTPDGSVTAGTDEALYVEGALEVDGELEADGNVDADGDLDVDGTANLDAVDVDGALNLVVYQEHIGVMSVMTRAITYTAGAGGTDTLLSMDAGSIYFVYSVFIETTTEWTVTAGDDETLTIGDGNDPDGFLAAAHTQLVDTFTEATGYASGWYGLENGSGGAYTLDDGGPFVYDNAGAETVDIAWGATGDDLTAGAATAYIVYMRIQ